MLKQVYLWPDYGFLFTIEYEPTYKWWNTRFKVFDWIS